MSVLTQTPLSPVRQVLCILFYVVAGCLFLFAQWLMFVTPMHSVRQSDHALANFQLAKIQFFLVFLAIAWAALIVGLVFAKMRHAQRTVGIVLMSASAIPALVVVPQFILIYLRFWRTYITTEAWTGLLIVAATLAIGLVLTIGSFSQPRPSQSE